MTYDPWNVYTFLLIGGFVAGLFVLYILAAMTFRRVVTTNTVHIVQSRKKTISYGTGTTAGNVYYQWPAWVPFFGVSVINLPVSNFNLALKDYEAYDKDRVPFMVDVVAFFRISDTDKAAQRVTSMPDLAAQLTQIVQGAVRKILASAVIDTIMLERAQFGRQFTDEVREQLQEWGVEPVKSMELMDIRDNHDSKVIANIMAKKTSHIEMLSRTEVAGNKQAAATAEIVAARVVEVAKQEAEQTIGQRTAEKEREIGVAQQKSQQEILAQRRETTERNMAVNRVQQVREAEIQRDEQLVVAEKDQRTQVIRAEGALEAKKREANGIQVEGAARAEAAALMQLAPVRAQIELAHEIGTNANYQQYLVAIETIKAHIAVGTKQAEALVAAQIKIIANTGAPIEGVKDVMDLFSSKGGTALSSMVEAFGQTPLGKAALDAAGVSTKSDPNGAG